MLMTPQACHYFMAGGTVDGTSYPSLTILSSGKQGKPEFPEKTLCFDAVVTALVRAVDWSLITPPATYSAGRKLKL